MIASIPFLVATFFVYGCIRELRNLHGKSLMAYVLSLTLMYASMAVILLYDRYLYENYLTICKIFGHLLMMSTFTSFFWLNVMCFDIWTTFKG
jgi:G protein-coupled receptor Mth (Methuselah protein)